MAVRTTSLARAALTLSWLAGAGAMGVARPALRLGGEWAGNCVAFSDCGAVYRTGVEELISEEWTPSEAGSTMRAMSRRRVRMLPEEGTEVSQITLPQACSSSTVLQPGNAMFEPDVLNTRAWALDEAVGAAGDEAASGGEAASGDEAPTVWRCETIFDGLGGDRPSERGDALECPAERTRVQCSFDPSTGTLVPEAPVLVWQERCWSASPKELDPSPDGIDAKWVSSVVGLECFGDECGVADGAAASGATTELSLGGGIELVGKPGLLEITLRSGARSRQTWSRIVLRRSWVGSTAGSSIFSEVDAYDETEGDD